MNFNNKRKKNPFNSVAYLYLCTSLFISFLLFITFLIKYIPTLHSSYRGERECLPRFSFLPKSNSSFYHVLYFTFPRKVLSILVNVPFALKPCYIGTFFCHPPLLRQSSILRSCQHSLHMNISFYKR